MPQDGGFKVVTIDEGSGPVKAVKDPAGRVLSAEQVSAMRQRHDAELTQATEARAKLMAKDKAATDQVVGQVKDALGRQLAALDRQRADLAANLAKLEAGEKAAVAEVVKRAAEQLARRIDWIGQAKDRSTKALEQMTPAKAPPAGKTA